MESREDIEEAAAAWISRRACGEWRASDEAEFGAWLRASTGHRTVFLRLDRAWQESARLKALGAIVQRGAIPARGDIRGASSFDHWNASSPVAIATEASDQVCSRRTTSAVRSPANAGMQVRQRRAMTLRSLAASVFIALALMTAWLIFPRGPSYRTDVGRLADVSMADGSHVILNTASEIRVAMTPTERRVELERGEAFFDVAKDSARPFIVDVGDQRVTAMGTKFSVRRVRHDVHVVVIEGRVRVEREGGAAGKVPPAELSAGSIARSGGQSVLIQKKSIGEVEQYLSWRSGFLIFRETVLADAVAEFNRYNEPQIVIDDPKVASLRIDGHFRSTNVEAFVRLLEAGFPVEIERRAGEIIVRAR